VTSTEYWFADPDSRKVVQSLAEGNASGTWSTHPIIQAWVRNQVAYYSAVLEPSAWDTSLSYMGDQGELVKMVVPLARSFVRQLVSIITKQKLNFAALAQRGNENDIVKVTKLANALAAQIVNSEDVDEKFEFVAEQTFVVGAGFMMATWRTDKGRPFAVDDSGRLIFDGEADIQTPTVWDVLYDYSVQKWEDLDWVQVRTVKNRYSLIAQFPDMAQQIAALPSIRDWRGAFRADYRYLTKDDLVYTYEVYHKPTPALPQGRMVFYSDDRTVYFDGENAYKCIPVEIAKPEVVSGTGFGYPLISNILPAQEIIDTLWSSIATNQSTFATQNVAVPRGANVSVQDILGMNFFSFTPMPGVQGGGMPVALNLTQTPAEVFKSLDLLSGVMRELTNINSALRGDPPAQVSSGTAIATLTSTAIEAINSSAKATRKCVRKTMMHAINAYRQFAKVPHLVTMAGRNNETFDRKFIGTDLDPIQQIELTETNPLMQTLSGRLEIADKLLQNGMVKDVKAYFAVLEGSPPKEMWEVEGTEEDLVRRENEALLAGEPVMVMNVDDHPYHIMMHKTLLADPKIRFDGEKVKPILDHMLAHYEESKHIDPMFAAMAQTGKMPEGGAPPPPSNNPQDLPELPPPPGEALDEMAANPAQPASDLLGRSL
jgi:hypothetical protein